MVDDISDRYKRRDYTRVIVRTEREQKPVPTPTKEPEQLKKTKKPRKKTRFTLSVLVKILVLALLIGAGFFGWQHFNNSSPIPKNVSKSASFKVYYPANLPAGYSFGEGSAMINNNILVYSLGAKGDKIVFTEQPAPSSPPDFNALSRSQFSKITTPFGQGIQGNTKTNQIAILLTNETLINITGPKDIPRNTFVKMIEDLKPI